MKRRRLALGCLSICAMGWAGYLVLSGTQADPSAIRLKNGAGEETRRFQPCESVVFSTSGLEPSLGYTIRITRDDGVVIDESGLSADQDSCISDTMIWCEIGLPPHVEVPVNLAVLGHLSAYAGRSYVVEVIYDDPVIYDRPFRVDQEGSEPMFYATDAWGNPTSGLLLGEEDVWVVGRNVPAGSIVRLWAVPSHGELPSRDHDKRLLDVRRATAAHANPHRGRAACFTGP
jgi:hypothetical protein